MSDKKKLVLTDKEYRKCSLCSTPYMNMLRIGLRSKEEHLLLCRTCYLEIKEAIRGWD